MKKLLEITFLVLLLTCNTNADDRAPIKHKRIECSSKILPGREKNAFLIISDDDKSAKLISIPWNKVEKYDVEISKTLLNINFKLINDWDQFWTMNRETGVIKVYSQGRYSYDMKCEPFSKNFNPEKFLKSEIKNSVKKVITKNKF